MAIDLETTGLRSDKDSIIELGAVRYKKGIFIDQYHALIKTEESVPDDITRLTGIDNKLLEEQGQSKETSMKGLLDFIKEDVLVGHYISFDMLFLRKTCKCLDIEVKQYKVIDTVALAKEIYKEPIENYKLETMIKQLEIAECQEHRALPDAILAAKLYLKLNK